MASRVSLGLCLSLAVAHTAFSAGLGRFGSAIGAQQQQQAQARPPVPELRSGHVRYDRATGALSFVKGLADGPRAESPAHGSFSDPLRHVSNFGQLRITTNPAFPDELQMQAAGFLEGYLTAERIFDYAHNMKAWLASQTNDTFAIGDWLFEQDRWTRSQVRQAAAAAASSASAASSPPPPGAPCASYWPAVGLLTSQMDGLLAGYSARLAEVEQEAAERERAAGAGGRAHGGGGPPLERLTKWDFLVLNALGDVDDLLGVVFPDSDDGTGTADYSDDVDGEAGGEDGAAVAAATGPAARRRRLHGSRQARTRTPNPERDASFFFRYPDPAFEAARAAAEREAEAEGAAEAGAVKRSPVPRRGSWEGLTPGQVRSRIAKTGRCSALVKVTPSLDDILIGHVTWWGYASMLRVYKHYDLRLAGLAGLRGGAANGRVSFSSYPGQLSSADDWYLLGSGMVVTETSLDVYDHNRYNASYGTGTGSLLSWQRVSAANLLAEGGDGPGWAALAAAYNGGTYNNQYMIVDLNRFTPGAELQPGLLTIMEIIPGMVRTADATADLERGHWPSYNVPYFPDVYEATGYRRHAAAMAARGPDYAAAAAGLSYQLAPRAKIFRRDAAGANDLASFGRLLRSNGYRANPADPLSAASPWDALCGRGDLDPEDPDVYGCYDGKVTNYSMALQLRSRAINGPTTQGGQPPFRWDAHPAFRRMPHRGMLDVFDTEWEEQAP
ncbi:hypothetical protein GPECTOR_47g360 [Gonium pectorale]|uniref:Phospholipase B-like n=1 Tax=Gonium pectorale TaxID=33097 RepID=A0A150G8C5_GONPE|nr:hypothetical protein GPECTOR_47g360 [Gonium pectorale]|eukprot:KXZ46084.1 hypothetical protein GPECTOR_47g360 [Gonium pectorale]